MSIHSDWILIDYIELYLKYSLPTLEKAAHSIIPGISRETVLSTLIPIPPLEEQKAIVDYLSKRTSKINEAIKESNNMISLLQERKQIIINEVVTGKVKVV